MFTFEADDWECRLGENEPQMFSDDADDVYGVNNLSYLQQQLKGYDAESNHGSKQEDEYLDGDNILVSTSEISTKDSISIDSSTFNGDEDGSGDGSTASDTEIKADYIPIPHNADPSGTVSTHLQRLSQIIKGLSSDQYQSFELGPDELNEFLALQKIKAELGNSKEIIINPNSKPIPPDGQVSPNDLQQIIDLQNKIKRLGVTRDTYSTTPTPFEHSVSGSGFYPSDATTLHISATNAMKNPRFPDVGYATSQIVVNRPEGSVVFSLPTPTAHEPQHDVHKDKPSISEETLKTLLEISKQMQPTHHTPSNVHPISTAPSPLVFQPIYNYPLPLFPNYDDGNRHNGARPMHKIASISGNLDEDGIVDRRPEDIGLSAVVHNHIPITITQPNVQSHHNRYKTTTTRRPTTEEPAFYDSYGTKVSGDSTSNKYYSYHQYNDEPSQRPTIAVNSEYGYQTPYDDYQPSSSHHFVQIPQQNQGVIHPQQPIPTFSSDDSRYTDKYYTPTPHLNSNNVNRYVNVEQKPFPTLQSTYDPMTSSSNPKPTYSQAPTTFLHSTTYSQYSTNYDDEYHRNGNENIGQGESDLSDNSEYNYSNSDETSGENVMNSLTNYNVVTSSVRTTKKPLFQFKPSPNENYKQIVNLNGNYMSLETYQSSIEPYLQSDPPQIEVLTCATGVRQANSTDCTKYFVCNSKNGKVLSYTCPPYTAFNPETKICNKQTFEDCHPLTIRNRVPTIGASHKLKQDAEYSLLEAQRIKTEALKAQHLAHQIRLETQKIIDSGQNFQMRPIVPNGAKSTRMPSPTPPMRMSKKPLPKPHRTTTTTSTAATTSAQANKKSKKRKIPCRTEGKLPDSLSKFNYFMCYKGTDGKMRARKMQCPAKLIFCPGTRLCTSTSRCN